jgi:hypothetical protein
MSGTQSLNGALERGPQFAGRCEGSFFQFESWMPSEIEAISPLVDRLMRLIEGSHCVAGEEPAVELALREALHNAVVHGNRMDRQRSWFKSFVAANWKRGFASSSRTRDKDLTRARCPILQPPKTSGPITGAVSG